LEPTKVVRLINATGKLTILVVLSMPKRCLLLRCSSRGPCHILWNSAMLPSPSVSTQRHISSTALSSERLYPKGVDLYWFNPAILSPVRSAVISRRWSIEWAVCQTYEPRQDFCPEVKNLCPGKLRTGTRQTDLNRDKTRLALIIQDKTSFPITKRIISKSWVQECQVRPLLLIGP
jgi:hypothetical protein